jgi:hypothetical protein
MLLTFLCSRTSMGGFMREGAGESESEFRRRPALDMSMALALCPRRSLGRMRARSRTWIPPARGLILGHMPTTVSTHAAQRNKQQPAEISHAMRIQTLYGFSSDATRTATVVRTASALHHHLILCWRAHGM